MPSMASGARVDVPRIAVVAVGGNALTLAGELGTGAEELDHAQHVARGIARLVREGWSVAVTHGNGPQVGQELRRGELASAADPAIPRMPLDECVARTQATLGQVLTIAIEGALRESGRTRPVVTLMTRALVSAEDPAFARPTKPVGPFYSALEAERLRTTLGWDLVEDAGRGHRRVVPSPKPLRLLESRAVDTLLRAGFIVIAAGGGGIPVVREPGGRRRGIEAVIDKDYSSALLAIDVRAELLVFATSVDRIAVDYGTPHERPLDTMTVETAAELLRSGEFAAGSMGPKVASAIHFLRAGAPAAREVVVTSADLFFEATLGRGGTRLVPSERPTFAREATT
jgi:carbamate kinase